MVGNLTRRDAIKGAGAVGLTGLTATSGCLGSLTGGGGEVTVGSKQFTEQELLGHMTYETLSENTDLTVNDQIALGGTSTNFEALRNDQIDMYWEYTGTAWATLPPKHDEVITDSQEIYEKVKEEFQEEHSLKFLERAPFNNTYVLVANSEWADEAGVNTLSEFAEYLNEGNTDLTVVMNAEFQDRADGWPGLTDHYGLSEAASNLDIKNVGSGLTYQIVGEGEAEVGMGFNTNPKIIKFDLRVLEDDESFFPVYNPAPLVRTEALDANPSIEDPLNAIGPKLTTEKIRELNKRVSIDDEEVKSVAREFLSDAGLI